MELDTAKGRLDMCYTPGMSRSKNHLMYTEWSKTYDADHEVLKVRGPTVIAQALAELHPVNKDNICILDLAAGTGLVGVELRRYGFTAVDALEDNEGMLECARNRKVYRKEFKEAVPDKGTTSITYESYDSVTCRGGFGHGALPVNAVTEMLRIVKPGGYIIIVLDPHNFENVPEYKNRLKPQMDDLVKSKQWEKVKESIIKDSIISSTGFIENRMFVYRKSHHIK